jgi:hypothetical protein
VSDAVEGLLRVLFSFGLLWACVELGIIAYSVVRERRLRRARAKR